MKIRCEKKLANVNEDNESEGLGERTNGRGT